MRYVKRLMKDKMGFISFLFLSLLVFAIIFATYLAPYDPDKQDIMNKLAKPSLTHWLGTDQLGRDIFSRILYGGRVTIALSCVIVLLIVLVGVLLGGLAGFMGGTVDELIMRSCDWLLSLPNEMLSLCIVGILGPSLLTIILALTVVRWPWYIKMVRAEIMKEKQKNYILFSISSGKKKSWIVRNHFWRPLSRLLLVYSTLDISAVVMSISSLSFLGIGLQPPTAEWGGMLNEAREIAVVEPWQMIPAGVILFVVVAMLNYLGDVFFEHYAEKR